jgi:uncharacterized protein (DUF58 family)
MTRSGPLLAVGGLTLVVAWLTGSHPLGVVGAGVMLAGLGARLWASALRGRVALERSVGRHRHVEGEDVVLRYRLDRASRVPAGAVRVVERGGRLGRHETRLRRGRGETLLRAVPRGRHIFDEVEIVLDDPLGLQEAVLRLPAGDPVVVVPRVVELERIFSESGRHGSAGRRLLLRRASGYDLHSVREYEQGEPLRSVHWPTTARLGRLMVRELEDAPRDDIVVLLDCDAEAVAGPVGDSSFDAQVRAAGSLLRAHAAQGKRASLVLGTAGMPLVRVASLEGDWEVALDALAAVEPVGRSLSEVLADERGPAARAAELVVVTARLDPRTADRLAARGAGRRVSVVWVDGPSFAGRTRAVAEPVLVRLATAGVPVAVVRRGDDLERALEGESSRRASA